jgi:hypothetical protein
MALPPSKIIVSAPLPSQHAHQFLSDFLTESERYHRNDEISLANLRRINKALQGIHVPRPAELAPHTNVPRTKPPTEGEAVASKNIEPEEGADEWGEVGGASDEVNVNPVEIDPVPAVASQKEKALKKAEKKARRKEDKHSRAEKRKDKKRNEVKE